MTLLSKLHNHARLTVRMSQERDNMLLLLEWGKGPAIFQILTTTRMAEKVAPPRPHQEKWR